jgi:hypothetical protein
LLASCIEYRPSTFVVLCATTRVVLYSSAWTTVPGSGLLPPYTTPLRVCESAKAEAAPKEMARTDKHSRNRTFIHSSDTADR